MKGIKNLIFDWCGTLSDDLVNVFTASMNVFGKLGLKRRLNLEEFKREFRAPYMDFYRKFTKAPRERIDSLYLQEIRSLEKPKPFPRVKELLEFLNKKGKKLAILSSYPQGTLEEEIEYHGFQKFFLDIVGSAHNKAKAMAVLMERNGFLAQQTAYVGDMAYDIEVGKTAKVTTIAVSWGYQPKEKLLLSAPDFLIEDLRKIKKIISQAT